MQRPELVADSLASIAHNLDAAIGDMGAVVREDRECAERMRKAAERLDAIANGERCFCGERPHNYSKCDRWDCWQAAKGATP
jgi:hypothetical protein